MENNNDTTVPVILQAHREMLSLAFALMGRVGDIDVDDLLNTLATGGASALSSANNPPLVAETFRKEVEVIRDRAKILMNR